MAGARARGSIRTGNTGEAPAKRRKRSARIGRSAVRVVTAPVRARALEPEPEPVRALGPEQEPAREPGQARAPGPVRALEREPVLAQGPARVQAREPELALPVRSLPAEWWSRCCWRPNMLSPRNR